LSRYPGALRAHQLLAGHVGALAATLDRAAMLVSLAEDVRSGQAACLPWPPHERDRVRAMLAAPLQTQPWTAVVEAARAAGSADRWRAAWIAGAARETGAGQSTVAEDSKGKDWLEIRVVVADPTGRDEVSTRILINGDPVIAAAFDKGPAHPPEALLSGGRLHATGEPREVQLAEAYCTEGCCGALYVTIVRVGDMVAWRDWRGHTSPTPPSELRFDAVRYDAEIAWAQADTSWEWTSRTVARLVRTQIRQRPDLLTRWQCQPDWVAARAGEREQIRLSFFHPNRPQWPAEQPWLQFEQVIAIDDTPAQQQAAAILEQLETADPKPCATVVGGNADFAGQLGYPWPPAAR
jgi:hypothetical protein